MTPLLHVLGEWVGLQGEKALLFCQGNFPSPDEFLPGLDRVSSAFSGHLTSNIREIFGFSWVFCSNSLVAWRHISIGQVLTDLESHIPSLMQVGTVRVKCSPKYHLGRKSPNLKVGSPFIRSLLSSFLSSHKEISAYRLS